MSEHRISAANTVRRARVGRWYAPGRFGLFYHYGLFTGGGNAESSDRAVPMTYPTVEAFEAAAPDPRAIARNMAANAKDCGARYAILTVCHSCGGQVVLYPTALPGFLHKTKGDYIGAFLEECRAAGVMPMLYVPCDCHNWDNALTGPNVSKDVGESLENYASLLLALIDELHDRYGDLPAGFWLDGGVPPTCRGVPARLHELWPDAVIVGNSTDLLDNDDIDYGTTECLEEGEKCDPPYDRPSGYRKFSAWGCTLPRTDFNEDIPAINGWWYHGETEFVPREYIDDRFFLLRQMISSLGQRGQWNFAPGIGPRIDGTIQPSLKPAVAAIGEFLSWAGEAIYGTTGPAGTFVQPGWINTRGSLSYMSVTNRLDNPSVFYAIFTEAPTGNFAMIDTMGREPRRVTDLRTGAEIPFRMWSGPVFEGDLWGDVAQRGATVFKMEF